MKVFYSSSEWWGCAKTAASNLSRGTCLFMRVVFVGISSVLCALWRLLSRWVGSNPSVALGGFLAAIFITWLLTFAAMRARAVGAESQRDRLSYEYATFKEQHGYEID